MLTIEKNNIVLDGNGYALIGSQGLKLTKVANVTVKDLTISTHYLAPLVGSYSKLHRAECYFFDFAEELKLKCYL